MGPWIVSLVATATAASGVPPVACDTAALRAELRARDPSDRALGALADTLTVTSTGAALVATLTQPGDEARAPRERTLRAARCDTLARAVALVATRWAHEANPPPASTAGDQPTSPEGPISGAEPIAAVARADDHDALALRVALIGVAHVDLLPGFAGGLGGALELARGPWVVRATLELARSEDVVLTPATRVSFLAPATRASLCRRALAADDDTVALSGCAHAALALVIAGRVDGDVGGDDGVAPWFGLGGGARLDVRVRDLWLTAEVGLLGAAARSVIVLADGTPVYTPGVVAPFAALGVGLALP